jgi:site-specific DNA recombinase
MPSTNGHGPKRAILYARVSTDEQARSGYSLAQQMEALREYATREGYEVLAEVEDPGQSGASLERPGMDQVRDLVAAGGVSVVLAQDRDRFAREPAYHYLLRREFEEHGTKIRALNDRGDDSPEGQLTDGIIDQIAKFERAKTAERTRRGKLKKLREGKILANGYADYGFRYNASRDSYIVDQETMSVVRRIFRMVGLEGASITGVARALNRESVEPPGKPWNKSGRWATSTIRNCIIADDVYKPHAYDEVKELIAPQVAARLDPNDSYGIWWYNRTKANARQVALNGANGKEYKRQVKYAPRPRAEWIAVPVPDAGVPREWVDAARAAIEGNHKHSNAGRRFWELSGGIMRCEACSHAMVTHTVTKKGRPTYFYYVCQTRYKKDRRACAESKHIPAAELETQVWNEVSGLMKSPDQLTADLERMIELERQDNRGDPDREAKVWLDKLTEVDQERRGCLRLAAKGRMSDEDLDEALAELEETRKTAQREIEFLKHRRERIEQLERDKEALLDYYEGVVPEALDSLVPEERHRFYKLVRLQVIVRPDQGLEISWAGGEGSSVCKNDTVSPRTSGLTLC